MARKKAASLSAPDPDNKRVPTDEMDPLVHFKRFMRLNSTFCQKEWERAEENQKFASGGLNQWDKAAYEERVRDRRPTYTINDCNLIARSISGRETTGRFEPTTISKSPDDMPRAAVCKEVLRDMRKKAMALSVESAAFRDLIIDNYSVMEVTRDYSGRDPRGKTIIKHAPLWEHIWDKTANEACFLDRKADARGYLVDVDEFLMLFPEEEEFVREAKGNRDAWITADAEARHAYPWAAYSQEGKHIRSESNEIFLVSYHWREREPAWAATVPPGFGPHPIGREDWATAAGALGLDPNMPIFDTPDPMNPQAPIWSQVEQALGEAMMAGTPIDPRIMELAEPRLMKMDEAAFRGFEEEILMATGAPPTSIGPQDGVFQWARHEAMIAGGEDGRKLLRRRKLPGRHFPRIWLTSVPFRQRDQTTFNSVIEDAKDPQRFKNYAISVATTHMLTSQKRGIIYKSGVFEEEQELATKLAQPLWVLKAKVGADLENGFKIVEGGGFPPGLDQFIGLADMALWRGTGLNPQTLGNMQDPRRVSGVVFQGLLDAPTVVLSQEFEALKAARVVSAEIFLDHVIAYEDRRSVLDVVGPGKAAMVPSEAQWEHAFSMDVFIEEVPASTSEKERSWELMSRQGTLEKWIQGGIAPPWLAPIMMPDSWVPEEHRVKWLAWLEARGMGPDSPPPPQPEAPPADGSGGQPPEG